MFRPILIGRRFRSFAVLQVLVEFYDLLAWAVDQEELVECVDIGLRGVGRRSVANGGRADIRLERPNRRS